MKVKDVMHKGMLCVEGSTPVREIAKRMRQEDVGAIPVKTDGQLIGIVTDRDIACRAVRNGADISGMTAKDVMTPNAVCCSPEDDIAAAVAIMERRQIRRLPVTNGHNALLGMLSLGDISHKVNRDLSGEVLRAVSGHHS